MKMLLTIFCIITSLLITACTHSVQLKAPEKPIDINIDMKIKVEQQVDKAITSNSKIF